MAQPGISILIPVYNWDVSALVDSIHSQAIQSGVPFEIRVQEDASTKFLVENKVVTKFKEVSYTIAESNVGRAATRNNLAEQARYDWLLFLDADVMPVSHQLIEYYIEQFTRPFQVFCGGIAYEEEKPDEPYMLRWKYGHHREAKSAATRNAHPYHVVSANILIKRKVFFNANVHTTNMYGLDNYFSYNLKKQEARVLHIDNPVYHLGLEKNAQFLQKAMQAVDTTVALERDGILKNNQRPLQQAYLKLKKIHADGIFNWFLKPFLNKMRNNFLGASPNMFYFDLYRLYHYIKLKRKNNA